MKVKSPLNPKTATAQNSGQLPPEVRPGQSVELLKELHILTRDGKLNQDSRRKLKQVYHLYQFIEKLLLELPDAGTHASLADHGAGKSYLGFILYDLFFKAQAASDEPASGAIPPATLPATRSAKGPTSPRADAPGGHIYGIESRAELVTQSQALARRLGFTRMSFLNQSVSESAHSTDMPDRIDVVTALHACDTATDDAIAFGLQKHAKFMVLVPCCQAEVARVLGGSKALSLARTPLAELWRHPLHTREMGSQITNVLRCLYLEASGYQVTVTELVGWEHSLKNELILARYTGYKKRAAAERLAAIVREFGLEELLQTRFKLPALANAPEVIT